MKQRCDQIYSHRSQEVSSEVLLRAMVAPGQYFCVPAETQSLPINIVLLRQLPL